MKLASITTLLISLLSFGNLSAQDITDEVTIVHFNANWNSANSVPWVGEVDDCELLKIDIATNTAAQSKYKIVVVPTIILFKDGEEIERWQADLTFKLAATLKDVQDAIDEVILSDF